MRPLHYFIIVFSRFKCFYDAALTELVNHYANEHYLFRVLRITPKSRVKVCMQWRMSLSPPPSNVASFLPF